MGQIGADCRAARAALSLICTNGTFESAGRNGAAEATLVAASSPNPAPEMKKKTRRRLFTTLAFHRTARHAPENRRRIVDEALRAGNPQSREA